MKKKRTLDFIISENDYKKVIFRFYPRSSTCHSFGDNPPTKWEEVYKVYYHYKVICIYKDNNEHIALFDSGVDECSIIDEVANRMKLITEGTTVYKGTTKDGNPFSIQLLDNEALPFGDGVSWNIHKHYHRKVYDIILFDWKNVGYRMIMDNDKMAEFAKYLESCCEYMLAHGDPI